MRKPSFMVSKTRILEKRFFITLSLSFHLEYENSVS